MSSPSVPGAPNEGIADTSDVAIPLVFGWHTGEVVVRWHDKPPGRWGQQRCLCVGVNDNSLKCTSMDAQAVAGELCEGNGGYAPCEVLLEPTSDEVKKALTRLCVDAKDAHLVFFFSGHGVRKRRGNKQGGPLFLCCRGSMLALEDVGNILAEAKTSVIILDCCNAGNQDVTRALGDGFQDLLPSELEEDVKASLTVPPPQPTRCVDQDAMGQLVLCGCAGHQKAYEADTHGQYTKCLLEALGESHPSGRVTATELSSRVSRKMGEPVLQGSGLPKGGVVPPVNASVGASVTLQSRANSCGPFEVLACCIGIDNYATLSKLRHCVGDAVAMSEGFNLRAESLGVAVTDSTHELTGKRDIQKSLQKVLQPLVAKHIITLRMVVVYVASHALQLGEEVYLVPAGAKFDFDCHDGFVESVNDTCPTLQTLTSKVTGWVNTARGTLNALGANNGQPCTALFVLDACRDQGLAEHSLNAKVTEKFASGADVNLSLIHI
eukprot:TRINITY_DN3319_c0_g1_i17.p1 TRINITY_DN3319_c0_g1~~TRINITY_DN3319_c0_g1_i17.p1  ORF type:complete len:493 (-),score=60.81 TRINITY_DN3319_c0_g1_i17:130-1608(-)